jgi:RHS repeat-associated protein
MQKKAKYGMNLNLAHLLYDNPSKDLREKDYYPFGMVMPGRNFSSENYRFGFNGMVKDNELKGEGNSYDFGARLYDPRLGRWLAPEPLYFKYPGNSTYSFSLNNPIFLSDANGLDVIITVNIKYDGKTVILKQEDLGNTKLGNYSTSWNEETNAYDIYVKLDVHITPLLKPLGELDFLNPGLAFEVLEHEKGHVTQLTQALKREFSYSYNGKEYFGRADEILTDIAENNSIPQGQLTFIFNDLVIKASDLNSIYGGRTKIENDANRLAEIGIPEYNFEYINGKEINYSIIHLETSRLQENILPVSTGHSLNGKATKALGGYFDFSARKRKAKASKSELKYSTTSPRF